MLNVRGGLVVVGCIFVGFVFSAGPALVARAAEPPPWAERPLAPADSAMVSRGGEPQRSAQLEQPLTELAAERGGVIADGAASDRVSSELKAVTANNRELAARNRALAAENQALAQSHLYEPSANARACDSPPNDTDPAAQIRYWARRLRDGDAGFRGRLTAEQNAAVQVLLRPERELDPRNPWSKIGPGPLASAK